MSSIEATIASIQDPRLSREESFDLYLDYLNEKYGHKNDFYHFIFKNDVDPTPLHFYENLSAFRGWFKPDSDQFKDVTRLYDWNPDNIAREIQRSNTEIDYVNSHLTYHLLELGKTYFEHIVATDPFPDVKAGPMGKTLGELHPIVSASKCKGYFHMKLAVELHHRILSPIRNHDAPCNVQLADAWKIGNYTAFLHFVDYECRAPYMTQVDP